MRLPRDPHERLAELARAALTAYSNFGDTPTVSPVAESFNTIFHIKTATTSIDTALRVGPAERIHPEGTEFVEASWMRALRADAGVLTPKVYDTAAGQPFARVAIPALRRPRICMMFEWIEGDVLSEAMSRPGARQMGVILALIHEHAASWPPPDPEPLTADSVLYWQMENRLDELRPTGTLVSEALQRADAMLKAIWADPPHHPHLLHGDFTPDNVMVRGQVLVPIDFQDLVLGLDIQDLAIALVSFGRFGKASDLRHQFQAGYETIRPWPELEADVLEALIAARRLHQLNLALNLRKPGLDRYIARAQQLIGEWMA